MPQVVPMVIGAAATAAWGGAVGTALALTTEPLQEAPPPPPTDEPIEQEAA